MFSEQQSSIGLGSQASNRSILTYKESDPERSQVGHAAVCCSYINR